MCKKINTLLLCGFGFATIAFGQDTLTPLQLVNRIPRGIVTVGTQVTLEAPADAMIRYTTDLSIPSRTTGMIYTNPITIDKTTVLRACTYMPTDTQAVVVENFTYIIPVKGAELKHPNLITPEQYETGLKQLPIISLSTPTNDADSKIEKVGGFEYINAFGDTLSIATLAGIRGYGNSSYLNSEQKNFRIRFKKEFGASKIKHDIFPRDSADIMNPANEFEVLELKAGQDGPSARGMGMTLASQSLVNKTMRELGNIDLHTRYVHVFVNGLYHGVYTLKEKFDENFAKSYYGGKKSDYDVIESSWSSGILNKGTMTTWLALKNAVQLNRYDEVERYMNVGQFIDFMLMLMYFDYDWEFHALADSNMVHTKFIFECHDTDGALSKEADGNSYNYVNKWTKNRKVILGGPAGMFGKLLQGNNPKFKALLQERVELAYNSLNAPLKPEQIKAKLDALKAAIYPSYDLELARFNRTDYSNYDREYTRSVAGLPARYAYTLAKWREVLASTRFEKEADKPVMDNSLVTLYPNPAQDYLDIALKQLATDKEILMVVYNFLGQPVQQQTIGIGTDNYRMDLSLLPVGQYRIAMIASEQWIGTYSFSKFH